MKLCNDCGTTYIGNECPECGSVNFTETEKAPLPEKKKTQIEKDTKKHRRSVFILACFLIVFTVACVLAFNFLEDKIFGMSFDEKAELISLDMTKEQVIAIMGEPDVEKEKNGVGYLYFYNDSFKGKYKRYIEKMEKASNDIQKQFELTEKMEGKKAKLLCIELRGQDPTVSNVVFDNKHLFNKVSSYTGVKFNIDENFDTVEIIDGVVAISDEANGTFKFQKPNEIGRYDYILRYSNGSFIKSYCFEDKHFYLDGRPEGDVVEFDFSFSLAKIDFLDVKVPISIVSLSADGNLSIGNGIRSFKNTYTEGFEERIRSVSLPESIRTFDDDAFVSLPALTSVNLAANTDYVYEKDGVIYNNIETVTTNESELIVNELEIIYLNNDRLPQRLELENGILHIGPQFDNKTALVELHLPRSVEDIATYFVGCPNLVKVTADSKNECFITENDILYFKDPHFNTGNRTVFIPRDYTGAVKLKFEAALCQFEGRSKVTSIEGLLTLGGTLKGCSSLSNISINQNHANVKLGQLFGTEE